MLFTTAHIRQLATNLNSLGQHLKDSKNEYTKETFAEIERMIGRGKLDLPLSLCFAAIREDESLMERLLKQGLDPNESEDSGRTALVCNTISTTRNFDCIALTFMYYFVRDIDIYLLLAFCFKIFVTF